MKSALLKKCLFALVASFLGLCLIECGLRGVGYVGEPDRTVSWCREHARNKPPFFVEEEVGGTRSYVPHFDGQPRPFPVEKAPNTRRIFVFGGSAVHGYGFTRAGSWPDKLEERLAMAWPGTRVEVINAGAIAWSSQQLLSLIKNVLTSYEPDAILLVSGNNELLEWFDARKYLPEPDLRAWVKGIRRSVSLRRFRLYRLLSARFGGAAGQWGQTEFTDDEALPWAQRARMRDADREFALEQFRSNVGRILEEASEAGVPVVLGTVPVNWLEPPAEFDFADAYGEEERSEMHSIERVFREGRHEESEDLLVALMDKMPEAVFAYRFGRMAREEGRIETARRWLGEAIRLDENPHRALPALNEVIRDLKDRADGFLDLERLLEAGQADEIIDTAVVYDYCHLRPDAHTQVADAMATLLATEIWPGGKVGEAPSAPPDHFDAWLGEGVDGNLGGYSPNPWRDRKQWWINAQDRVEQMPENGQAWTELARIIWHSFHGQCGEGRAPCLPELKVALNVALSLDSEDCTALANQGRVIYALGDENALDVLGRAVDCDPGDQRSAWYLDRATSEIHP